MDLEQGTRRDIAVIKAVREAVGPECPLMLDANNGYNLNLAKRVLSETAPIYWLEEPFHEDPVLYEDLKSWLDRERMPTLIADGEGDASLALLNWARRGLIDVVQYDIHQPGFTRWVDLGSQLDEWGVRSAPHHYGALYGNFTTGHLAAHIRGFTFVEWDEASCPGLDSSGYTIENGRITVPDTPGFGLHLEDDRFLDG